jgi:hypothetical protein
MFPDYPTSDVSAVRGEVQCLYLDMFPEGDRQFVSRAFAWAVDCFEGRFPGYQAIDARYHNLEHTLQGTLCMARLLHCRHRVGALPEIDARLFELGLRAILLHDSGYLKVDGDTQGSGAKYTAVHVERSAAFAGRLLSERGFSMEDIRVVQNMIHCTGINADLHRVPFEREAERVVGLALGTADLIGQMAAPDYVEKLPILFSEFKEASQFGEGLPWFEAEYRDTEELMRKTPDFWHAYVLPKLELEFDGLYRFLNDPYPGGPNEYIQRIQSNMERLRTRSRLMGQG